MALKFRIRKDGEILEAVSFTMIDPLAGHRNEDNINLHYGVDKKVKLSEVIKVTGPEARAYEDKAKKNLKEQLKVVEEKKNSKKK